MKTFEEFINEGLFTKPKLKYRVGDYVFISKLGWIENHFVPKMPPSFVAEIIEIDDRPLLKQYADLKSKWYVIKRNILNKLEPFTNGRKDKNFPYIVEFIDGSKNSLCDDDISMLLDQKSIDEYELEKSANKYNL